MYNKLSNNNKLFMSHTFLSGVVNVNTNYIIVLLILIHLISMYCLLLFLKNNKQFLLVILEVYNLMYFLCLNF